MHRIDILQQLNDYQARWTQESATVQRFIDYITASADCFHRELKVGHVTGSAWLVNRQGTHVLLTHHRKLNRWLQLGGHADGDSDVLRVARREVEEESGLVAIEPIFPHIYDIDVHEIPERIDEPAHNHWDIRYALRATESESYIVSDESHDLAWIEITSLTSVTSDESVLRMARKWVALSPIPPVSDARPT